MKPLRTVAFAIYLALAACLDALAQDKPLALSADEAREVATARQAVEQARAARAQAWQAIQQTDVGDCGKAMAAIAIAQRVEREIAIFEARADGLLWKLRASHACADCELGADGKFLVKAKPEIK